MQKFLKTESTPEKFDIHYQDQDEDDLKISNSKSANTAILQTTKIDWRAFMNPAANQGGCCLAGLSPIFRQLKETTTSNSLILLHFPNNN